jgi:hypothetical protein
MPPEEAVSTACAKPTWKQRLLIVFGSTVVALLLGEVVMRVRAHFENRETLETALAQPVQLMKNGEAPLGGIIRLNSDARITYELKPNLSNVIFKGHVVNTDSRGFRSPELPDAKTPHTVTIVGLGDSMMFGQGVADGEAYLDELRRQLTAHHPEIDWCVVNTAVTGYNTVMEVATLETKCLSFEPDFVVMGVYSNDYDPPNYVREEDDVFDLGRSFLLELFQARLARKGVATPGLVFRGTWEDENKGAEREAPKRYDQLHGPAAFASALDKLKGISDERKLPVLVLATVDFMQVVEMMQTAEARGLDTLHLQSMIEEYVSRSTLGRHSDDTRTTQRPFDWRDYENSDLVLNAEDVHPSAIQHRMVGEKLYQWLVEHGHVERWIAERARKSSATR